MSVSQRIDPALCDAWIFQQLQANSVLMSLCKGRFYEGDAVPTPEEGQVHPFIYWTGGMVENTVFYDRERETAGVLTSRYAVRVQKRFDGRPPGNWSSEFYHQLRASLTGIRAREVIVSSTRIGEVWTSRWKSDFQDTHKDGEARILESGILIEISHL